jgi:hypothetical protein
MSGLALCVAGIGLRQKPDWPLADRQGSLSQRSNADPLIIPEVVRFPGCFVLFS